MTDPVDTDLANRMRASLHLISEAKAWERVASDESLQAGVREFARQRAQAIREEISPC